MDHFDIPRLLAQVGRHPPGGQRGQHRTHAERQRVPERVCVQGQRTLGPAGDLEPPSGPTLS